MKNEPEPVKKQTELPNPAATFSYEVSRKPKNRHKKLFAPVGVKLTTPSGAKVPPGWRDVWMTTDSRSPVQAIARDSKGRWVYLYSAEHMGTAAAAKFVRLRTFVKAYPSLLKRIKRDMKISEDALALYLIAQTGFRIGSDSETQAAAKAFGASTLKCAHVNIDGGRISFDFTGKKGVRVTKTIKDKYLADRLAGRCRIAPDQRIFNTTDDSIRAYLNTISSGRGFTVKDFRTYVGTLAAFRKINSMPVPENSRETQRYKREVGKRVAMELGNTPAIALNSYVSPEVFCAWESGWTERKKKAANSPVSLTREFLDCIHYDRSVPAENSADSSGSGNFNDGD
jgi:DNA topoisomerase IB